MTIKKLLSAGVLIANIVLALAVAPLCFVGHITSGKKECLSGLLLHE